MARKKGAGPDAVVTATEARKVASGRAPSSPTSAKPQWRDVLPIHPAAEMFPLMKDTDPDALRALGEDIKQNGLNYPIILYRHKLLDGRSRLDAMELVGIEFKLWREDKSRFELTAPSIRGCGSVILDDDADPYAKVVSLNLHRRHLTAEQKRDVIAALLKATPEKSNRQIAETVKVSHVTVGAVRTEMESTGQIDQLKMRVGKDRKARRQPARKPPSPAVVKAAADRAEASSGAQTVDRVLRVGDREPRVQTTRYTRKIVAPYYPEGEQGSTANKQEAAAGNDVDPQASADERKAEAAAERDAIGAEVNSFHREAMRFVETFGERFTAWLEAKPALDVDAKAALMQALYLVAGKCNEWAQKLDGRGTHDVIAPEADEHDGDNDPDDDPLAIPPSLRRAKP